MAKSNSRKLLLLAGDGIGPEVVKEVKKIIEWLKPMQRFQRLRVQSGQNYYNRFHSYLLQLFMLILNHLNFCAFSYTSF